MEQPKFIESELPDNKGLDFDFLRQEGVRLIQQLTGSFWTDFNEHDPGVTILEQIAYALTEVSFKSQFDIKDILHSEESNEQSFFRPDQVLPCNALTTDDYRKILFDSVFEINNVWVFSIKETASNISGLYRVLIDIDEQVSTKESKNEVKEKTLQAFNSARNICEDVGRIDIVEYVEVGLSVDIELTGQFSLEEVMANVFYKVDNFLCPEIKFYSLDELLEEGYQLNDIFNGPLLKHGFVKTDDLPDKTERVLVSEVMKIIMQVEGVSSVKNLKLIINDEYFDNQITLSENELPRLKPTEVKGQPAHQVNVYKGDVLYRQPNFEEVRRNLNELKSANRRVYRLNEKVIDVPKGQKVDIQEYYSLQNQFPAIYGIGEEGIPGKPNVKRKAQAKQLKGYLMLFEQVIANSLAQLSHAKDLLSFNSDFESSYFTQELANVPDVTPLLKKQHHTEVDTIVSPNDELTSSYKRGLPQILSFGENRFDRVQRLLDYLLALHGEEYVPFLTQFNYYFGDKEFEEYLNKNKIYFLRFLPFINNGRSKGYNYLKNFEEEGNVSGLEVKLSVLLGLNAFLSLENDQLIYKKKSIFSVFDNYDIQLNAEVDEDDADSLLTIPEDVIEDRFEIIDEEEIDVSRMTEEKKHELLSKSLFSQKNLLTPAVLVDGLNVENYRIGTLDENVKSITVAYFSREHDQWLVLSKFRTYAKAEHFVMLQIELIRSLNMSCEGVHMIEHVVLRPQKVESKFGLFILNEDGEHMLGSMQTFSFEERIQMSKTLEPLLMDVNNYSVEINNNRDFEIHFKSKDTSFTFVSINPKISVEETREDLENLVRYLSSNIDASKKFDYFVRYSDESPRIPEDFFSHRLSVFFPNWTARFSDDEYRRVTEEVIANQKPASVSTQLNWLDFSAIRELETLLFEFSNLKCELSHDAHASEDFGRVVDKLSKIVFELNS